MSAKNEGRNLDSIIKPALSVDNDRAEVKTDTLAYSHSIYDQQSNNNKFFISFYQDLAFLAIVVRRRKIRDRIIRIYRS